MKRLILTLLIALHVLAVKAYTSREIMVSNPSAAISLGATLTAPESAPKAVLVLASGSGQQNRDEEILGHKPFKAIAEYLAERGYAVLRMDDRGMGESGGVFQGAVNDDFVSDVAAAVSLMDSIYPGVPTGVLGHSEGGTTAIKTAVSNPKCKFIITLAAPSWAGDSIIMSQIRALAVGSTGAWEKDKESLQRRLLDMAKGPLTSTIVRTMIITSLGEQVGRELAALPEVQAQLSASADAMVSPWYRDMLRYNPAADIAAVNVPWLALNGDKDMQVLPDNLTTIAELNPAVDVRLINGHNHLFLQCQTGMVQEYSSLPGDISEKTLQIIAEWLDSKF